MSASGAGKSTLLATMPAPRLVLGWDPPTKFDPYYVRGTVGASDYGAHGQLITPVHSTKNIGTLVTQVENFYDEDPKHPTAFTNFLPRLTELHDEVRQGRWASVILDTVTFMEIAARKMAQYVLNPGTKEPRQWYATSTDECEEVLCMRLASLLCHVGIAAHIDKDKDEILPGEQMRGPSAPGRLSKKDGLRAAYAEVYRLYLEPTETGQWVRVLQTTPRDGFACSTSPRVQAPDAIAWADIAAMQWDDIWINWRQRQAPTTQQEGAN